MKAIFLAAVLLLGLSACSEEQATFDEEGPAVEVKKPRAGQAVTGGYMPVEVVLSENLGLHTYFVWMVEVESGKPHLVDKGHLHARVHTVSTSFSLADLPKGEYELMVTATDHDQNTTEVRVPLVLK